MNLLQNFELAVIEHFIPHWLAVSSLTNNKTFENQLHATGAQLALVILKNSSK